MAMTLATLKPSKNPVWCLTSPTASKGTSNKGLIVTMLSHVYTTDKKPWGWPRLVKLTWGR